MSRETTYVEEEYWSAVAAEISNRPSGEIIAGDDDPYYRYKRERFLDLFFKIEFENKDVLEIGPGPGGNLKLLLDKNPASLTGADISDDMLDLAKKNLPTSVGLIKTNGAKVPLAAGSKDIVFSVTVLQHVTTRDMLLQLIADMARISSDKVYICERTESRTKGDSLNEGRPVDFYKNEMNQAGFKLEDVQYLNIEVSYFICGLIRRVFNNPWRKEGEPSTSINIWLQKLVLPVTKLLDTWILQKRDLTIMTFSKHPGQESRVTLD